MSLSLLFLFLISLHFFFHVCVYLNSSPGRNDSAARRNKRFLCAVFAGWQGDAVLALLAGPGPGPHHVFTQRLHLVCVSGAHSWKYTGESMHTTLGRVDTTQHVRTLRSALSWLCLAASASQHAAHRQEVSAGGGAGVGGPGRRPGSSGAPRRQQPQVYPLCRASPPPLECV